MKPTTTTQVTVDGVMRGNGAVPDEDGMALISQFQRPDAFRFGGRTYEPFAGYSGAEERVAAALAVPRNHQIAAPLGTKRKDSFNRAIERFQRHGRTTCRSEWSLIAASHTHRPAAARPRTRRRSRRRPRGRRTTTTPRRLIGFVRQPQTIGAAPSRLCRIERMAVALEAPAGASGPIRTSRFVRRATVPARTSSGPPDEDRVHAV
jgi:hypothetical protein